MNLQRKHSWPRAVFFACGLSMCIMVDIGQYSMPLAFLPGVLENRGHSTIMIASAIGVYYWTGFAGGLVITTYQIWRLVYQDGGNLADITTVGRARAYLRYLCLGLLVGTVTLFVQANYTTYEVHLWCRFLQGFAGSFIFFYAFLLSAELFKDRQQDFAMTAASCSLNVAEVLGSLFGALIFERYGQRTVFMVLGVASVINQGILLIVMWQLEADAEEPEDMTPYSPAFHMQPVPSERKGWAKLWRVLQSRRLAVAVLLIVMSALVKGAVEEMLPFHADHRWGLDPLEIGTLFAVIAFSYIASAVSVGYIWQYLDRYKVMFSSIWLLLLGIAAFGTFSLASFDMSIQALWVGLAFYGVGLGMTHTPAALFLADAIDHEEGAAKDAANAVWNTMWEAGGSLGFLLGGLLAHHYPAQLRLLGGLAITCVAATAGMLFLQPSAKSDDKLLEDGCKPRNGKTTYGAAS